VSLSTIAHNLGLSVTTVSRALGGFNDVAAATRARVEAEARRIGYQPNQAARIGLGDIHRAANPGATVAEFVEVQTGAILSEDDIERLEDMYGRS